MQALLLPSALLFLAALPAQTAAPAAVAPPQLLIDTVGPEGWRIRLGPTNLGSMLATEAAKGLWQPPLAPLFGGWQQLCGEEAAYLAARARLVGYQGRVRLGVWFATGESDKPTALRGALVLDGDGRTDLGALAQDLRQVQTAGLPGEWQPQEIDGQRVEIRRQDQDVMTAPVRRGEQLVVGFAGDGDAAAALAAATHLQAQCDGKAPPANAPAFRLRLDLGFFAAMALADAGPGEAPMLAELGLTSLGDLTATVSAAGPHVAVELAQQFRNDERGVFAALFPATQGLPAATATVMAMATPSALSWKTGRFDLRRLYESVEAAVGTRGDAEPATKLREEAKRELGIDPVEDLLAHTTDEVLLTVAPVADAEDPLRDATFTFAVRLRNEAAFHQGLTKMIAATKPFLSREGSERHGEVELVRYGNLLAYDLWLGVGRGMFVLAGGPDALAQAGALLDAAKTPAAEGAPQLFRDLTRYLPNGSNGLGRGDVDSVVGLAPLWGEIVGELTGFRQPHEPADPEAAQRFRALLKEHQLQQVRTATGFADLTWRWRMFW